jgi:hypothetical protein
LDAAERNAMSDSTYAFPRVRKEPLNDASHVRNAIARFDQVRDVTDEERREAFRRIQRVADKFGVEMAATRWQNLGKPSATMKSSDKPRTPTKTVPGDGGPALVTFDRDSTLRTAFGYDDVTGLGRPAGSAFLKAVANGK